jgi:hypothetical protein
MITIIDAIKSLNPNAGVRVGNNHIDDIRWLDGTTSIPKAEIDAEVIRLQAEYDAQEYARNRQAEYPSLLELTVALYDTDDKSAVEAKRAAVKAKYPKPS